MLHYCFDRLLVILEFHLTKWVTHHRLDMHLNTLMHSYLCMNNDNNRFIFFDVKVGKVSRKRSRKWPVVWYETQRELGSLNYLTKVSMLYDLKCVEINFINFFCIH